MCTEEKLNQTLVTPSPALIEDMKHIKGDIIILGAGGKMGPTLAVLAKNALQAAGSPAKVIAVSRFSDSIARQLLHDNDIQTISVDLLEENALNKLPLVENVIYMAGKKFGTQGEEEMTWAMNTWLPSRVAQHYKNARIVVFSTGNIYPKVPISSGGATEEVTPIPVGEYAMSSFGRERMFEYAAKAYGTKVAIYRLNYAIDLRYGVLFDIANAILQKQAIPLTTPNFNCIWQGDANEIAIRLLLHASEEVFRLNVSGPETASVEHTAQKLGKLLNKEPVFSGTAGEDAYLTNTGKMVSLFGYPTVGLDTLIAWQAEWIQSGGRTLNKPTHFEERGGQY